MQLASITFDGEKKNSRHYIIPPSYFKSKGITPIPVIAPVPKSTETAIIQTQATPQKIEVKEKVLAKVAEPVIPKISINKPSKVTSGLSLKSIREKKEHQIRQMDVVIDEENLPREPVTEEKLLSAWNSYIKSLHAKGEKIMASIMEMEVPVLKETAISLTYSNETSKIELERSQYPLLAHLRKACKNYDLHLDITVNEEVAKKYAFTPQEKYEKLKEKNENIELLKRTFGLDI